MGAGSKSRVTLLHLNWMKTAFTGGEGQGWGGGVKGLWEKNNNTYVATSFDWSDSERFV